MVVLLYGAHTHQGKQSIPHPRSLYSKDYVVVYTVMDVVNVGMLVFPSRCSAILFLIIRCGRFYKRVRILKKRLWSYHLLLGEDMEWGVKLKRGLKVISVAAILFRGEGASTSWDFVFLEVMDLTCHHVI